LEPEANDLAVDETFRVRLIARSSDGSDTPFGGTQAVLTWNPLAARLLTVDKSGSFQWLFSGFLPDVDNLNDGVSLPDVPPNNDGDAFYQGLPPAGGSPVATAAGLQVTTFRFQALHAGCATTLDIVPMLRSTRSLVRGDELGENVTGELGSAVLRIAGAEGDDDGDAVGNCSDACPGTLPDEAANSRGCSCSQVPPCDDGLFCNGAEGCAEGVCQVGVDPCPNRPCDDEDDRCLCEIDEDCDDFDVCTTDTCASGDCVNTDNSAPCDDGDACTEGDICAGGVCAGRPVDCSALGSPCRQGVCNPASGACEGQAINEGAGCADGDPCTRFDVCMSGACVGVPVGPVLCDFDRDCDVDLDDYAAFRLCSSPSEPGIEPPLAECLEAFDLDDNGDVDLLDWRGVQTAFMGAP